ncbi:MAG: glutaredoxin [Bacteriovoracaceae bacterium]|jgi:glutaredoxin 3|tara:strand:- start:15 stop:269 length:255 start_codon:yes stop_codon:yes gene_type:complete
MSNKVEVFSAGCPACESTIELVNEIACDNCEISILDMSDSSNAKRAKELGIERVPAVVVNGKLADCCQVKGPTKEGLKAAGIGS